MADIHITEHPKFIALNDEFGIGKCRTLGVLECIWHFTANYTPMGNIGKYSNAAIAEWMEWDRDAENMIGSLVAHRWLDANDEYRLLVHGWDEHAPDWVRAKLSYGGLKFCSGARANPNFHKRIPGPPKRERRRARISAAGGEVSNKLRLLIHTRDRFRCRECGTSTDLTVDHITAVANGGRTEQSNLQTLCRPCNSRKRDR